MSAGQVPSNPGGGQFPGGDHILPFVGGVYGGTTAYTQLKTTHNDRLERAMKRGNGLNDGSINPRQYVMYCSQDHLRPKEIKQGLLAWGGKSEGCDYSNSQNFDVKKEYHSSDNPLKNFMRFKYRERYYKDESCSLKVHPLDLGTPLKSKSTSSDKAKGSNLHGGYTDLRGGYTETTGVEEVVEDGTEMTPNNYRSDPHLFDEISEEYVQGISDRQGIDSFTCDRPLPVNPILLYVVSIGLSFGCAFLFKKFQRQYLRWKSPKDPQELGSTLEKNHSVEGFKRVSSEEQRLEVVKATPEFMLVIFIHCKKGTITKKAATRILMTYYDLTEAESLELLEEV